MASLDDEIAKVVSKANRVDLPFSWRELADCLVAMDAQCVSKKARH